MKFKDKFEEQRINMIETQIKRRGVTNSKIINALEKVERHKFMPEKFISYAYDDSPMSIGYQQTISQPYIVAFMTDLLDICGCEKILEIGTGSGYQTAILAELGKEIYTVEIIEELYKDSKERLTGMGYKNIFFKLGDGHYGWTDNATYDRIIITAAPDTVPERLLEQLSVNGNMVLPVGIGHQELIKIRKNSNGKMIRESLIPVRFVPMVGGN